MERNACALATAARVLRFRARHTVCLLAREIGQSFGPILGHNVSDGVEYAFMFLMTSPPLLPRYRASIPGFDMFPPEPEPPFVD